MCHALCRRVRGSRAGCSALPGCKGEGEQAPVGGALQRNSSSPCLAQRHAMHRPDGEHTRECHAAAMLQVAEHDVLTLYAHRCERTPVPEHLSLSQVREHNDCARSERNMRCCARVSGSSPGGEASRNDGCALQTLRIRQSSLVQRKLHSAQAVLLCRGIGSGGGALCSCLLGLLMPCPEHKPQVTVEYPLAHGARCTLDAFCVNNSYTPGVEGQTRCGCTALSSQPGRHFASESQLRGLMTPCEECGSHESQLNTRCCLHRLGLPLGRLTAQHSPG